jgi:thermostable 8-oxoguanine DNA glycosylase
MLMCLLTTQQRSGPGSLLGIFLKQNPFPLNYSIISHVEDVENYTRLMLQKNGLNRYINKIPAFFAVNLRYLEHTKWLLLSDIEKLLDSQANKQTERIVADSIDQSFKGFGSKQARNFLQALGLTKYEIPIDSRITNWLNDFGFPVTLSSTALQEKAYYHFVSDGIQMLCEKADIYPCVLDAAIFSSFDNGQWTKDNIIY